MPVSTYDLQIRASLDNSVSGTLGRLEGQLKRVADRAKAGITTGLNSGLNRTEGAAKRAQTGMSGLNNSLRRSQREARTASTAFAGLGTVSLIGIYHGARRAATGIASLLDNFTQFRNSVQVMVGAGRRAQVVMEGLERISSQTGQEVRDLGTIFTRLSLATRDFGITNKEALRFTESLAKSFAVMGASAQEAAGSTRQFLQGVAANRLSGQELNSVLEQNILLTRELAKVLDAPVSQVRGLANAGAVTSEIAIQALRNLESVDALFGRTQRTIAQLLTPIRTQLSKLFDTLVKGLTGGKGLNSIFRNLEKTIKNMNDELSDSAKSLRTLRGIFLALQRVVIGLYEHLDTFTAILAGLFAFSAAGRIISAFKGVAAAFRSASYWGTGLLTTLKNLGQSFAQHIIAIGVTAAAYFGVSKGIQNWIRDLAIGDEKLQEHNQTLSRTAAEAQGLKELELQLRATAEAYAGLVPGRRDEIGLRIRNVDFSKLPQRDLDILIKRTSEGLDKTLTKYKQIVDQTGIELTEAEQKVLEVSEKIYESILAREQATQRLINKQRELSKEALESVREAGRAARTFLEERRIGPAAVLGPFFDRISGQVDAVNDAIDKVERRFPDQDQLPANYSAVLRGSIQKEVEIPALERQAELISTVQDLYEKLTSGAIRDATERNRAIDDTILLLTKEAELYDLIIKRTGQYAGLTRERVDQLTRGEFKFEDLNETEQGVLNLIIGLNQLREAFLQLPKTSEGTPDQLNFKGATESLKGYRQQFEGLVRSFGRLERIVENRDLGGIFTTGDAAAGADQLRQSLKDLFLSLETVTDPNIIKQARQLQREIEALFKNITQFGESRTTESLLENYYELRNTVDSATAAISRRANISGGSELESELAIRRANVAEVQKVLNALLAEQRRRKQVGVYLQDQVSLMSNFVANQKEVIASLDSRVRLEKRIQNDLLTEDVLLRNREISSVKNLETLQKVESTYRSQAEAIERELASNIPLSQEKEKQYREQLKIARAKEAESRLTLDILANELKLLDLRQQLFSSFLGGAGSVFGQLASSASEFSKAATSAFFDASQAAASYIIELRRIQEQQDQGTLTSTAAAGARTAAAGGLASAGIGIGFSLITGLIARQQREDQERERERERLRSEWRNHQLRLLEQAAAQRDEIIVLQRNQLYQMALMEKRLEEANRLAEVERLARQEQQLRAQRLQDIAAFNAGSANRGELASGLTVAASRPAASGGTTPNVTVQPNVNIGVFDDRRTLDEWAASNEGSTAVINGINSNEAARPVLGVA